MIEQVYNRHLKDIAKEAKLTREIETTNFSGGLKVFSKVPLHELVTSHIGPKTFITHCVERGISPAVVSEITGKTVEVLIEHYYGTNKKYIREEMARTFGVVNVNMKVI